MDLTQEQKQQVCEWVAKGDGLADIQKRILEEFGNSMTYMDVRFMVLEIGAELQDPPEPTPPPEKPVAPDDLGEPGIPGEAKVSVDVDRITKPGSVVSGTVRFSDGIDAKWSVDQLGRLALDAGNPDYRPNDDDLIEFQEALQQSLAKRGM